MNKSILLLVLLFPIASISQRVNQQPLEKEAAAVMSDAQYHFEEGSYQLAIDGNKAASQMGLIDVSNKYKGTKTANLAKYYLGVSFLRMGEFQKAIDNFSQFESKEDLLLEATKLSLLGDAYSELKNYKEALKFYEKAGRELDHASLSPYCLKKAALLCEYVLKDKEKAKKIYLEIQKNYPDAIEALDLEKEMIRINQEK